ncbi:MAG: hypothetical protein JW751_25430 [Polyangiaceae bacterium]|nr:hypothetical protein [Polyangiaceae bacterium]
MTPTQCLFPEAEIERLRASSAASGRSVASIVRAAVRAHLSPGQSVQELVAGLDAAQRDFLTSLGLGVSP